MKNNLKLLTVVLAVAVSMICGAFVSAQEDGNKTAEGKTVRGAYLTNDAKDNWFIGVGGGITLPFHKSFKTALTPALDIYVGKWFTPCIGARGGYQGLTGALWSSTETQLGQSFNDGKNMYKEKFGFAYIHGDFLWNISNTIGGYKETRLWNFIPYAHCGFFHTYNRGEALKWGDNELALGFGLLNNIRVHNRVNITLDLNSIFINGRFHCPTGEVAVLLSAKVGVSVNLGKTGWVRASNWHNPVDTDKIAAVEASAAALAVANETLKADNDKLGQENQTLTAEVEELRKRPTETKAALEDVGPASVYFEIGQTTLSKKELQHLDFYLKNVLPNVGDKKVAVITGSADVKTGTTRRNEYLSKKRLEYVLNLLSEKYGIDVDRFQTRTQIAKEGDAVLNRAVIISFE